MKLKSVIIRWSVFAALIMAVAYAVFNNRENADIVIGAIVPLTGQFADAGNSVRAGLDIAAEVINADSDVKVKVVYYDTGSEARNATTGFHRLRTMHGIKIFVTTLSDHSFAIKPLASKEGCALFCIASHTDIAKDAGLYVFQMANTSSDEADYICDHIINKGDYKHVLYYGLNTEAGLNFKSIFESKLNNRFLEGVLYNDDYAQIKNLVASKKNLNSDCIVVVGYAPAMGYLIRQIRECGYEGPILSNVGFNTPSVIQASGMFATTVQFVDYDFPLQSEAHAGKNNVALTRYGASYNCLSYLAMGGCHMIVDVVSHSDSFDEALGKLHQNKEWLYEGTVFHSHVGSTITATLRMGELKD